MHVHSLNRLIGSHTRADLAEHDVERLVERGFSASFEEVDDAGHNALVRDPAFQKAIESLIDAR